MSFIIRRYSVGSDISLGLTTLVLGFISSFGCQIDYNVILVNLSRFTLNITAII